MEAIGLGGAPPTWGQEQRDRCNRLCKWFKWRGGRLISVDEVGERLVPPLW